MTRIAFCGLGRMGAPMAARLLDAGHDVVVWNRTAEKAEPLREHGARLAVSPRDAAEGVEAAITMLATPSAVGDVVLGRGDGLAAGLPDGATVLEMSTIGPDAVTSLRARLPERLHLLDAPVLGSVPQATEGTLKIFAGGTEDACRRWFPLLEALGSPRRVGALGAGAAMKVVVNATLVMLMSGLGEALALADALTLDQGTVLDVLADSPMRVPATSKRGHIETGTYPPNFSLALARKDAALVVETADRHAAELLLARSAFQWFDRANEAGLGELDYSAVITCVRGTPASVHPT